MKSFNLGKAVKKWVQQGKDYSEISTILNTPPQECMDAYLEYIGLKKRISKTSGNLQQLIKKKAKIHIFGKSGVGKTHTIKTLAEELGLHLITSYARSEEELVRDFGDGPFIDEPNLFILEGDNFYWRKYGLVKRYIEKALTPFIIITVGKNTPTKNITKLVKQIKIYPPTKADVQQWLNDIGMTEFPEGYPILLHDDDWRTIKHRFIYGISEEEYVPKKVEKFEAREMVYRIIKGTATLEDFDNCIHPLSFILNWLGFNTPNFYSGFKLKENMELISWIDANKYIIPNIYLKKALLQFIPTSRKARFHFPPYKRNKNNDKDTPLENEVVIQKFTKKVSKPKKVKKKKEKKKASILDDVGDFLLI